MVRCISVEKFVSGVICRFVPLVPIGSPPSQMVGSGPLYVDPGLQSHGFVFTVPLKGLVGLALRPSSMGPRPTLGIVGCSQPSLGGVDESIGPEHTPICTRWTPRGPPRGVRTD
ncbi:hypothetical protein NPIL_479931 [Nephila pilipes]|uniref:Uncharacterized protein n=1 Tax=Nephila pilipes TaxID=299642 RepID=A0A8X6P814_NEPPI|nr:hypothetical protein NPIL_479931 [Nephila pilipes]